jgi:hypothetical protein
MNVYAPTEESDDVGRAWFYRTVGGVDDFRSNYDIKMVIIDLNARLGQEDTYKGVTGKHSLHLEINNNRQRVY